MRELANEPALRHSLGEQLDGTDWRIDADARAQLLCFLRLLVQWNRVYNLSGIRDPGAMITRHVLDSLSILAFVDGDRVLDVGTGAGLPGLPLAIARRSWRVVLLDASMKKIRFCRQVVAELGLDNVSVVQTRVEDFQDQQGFSTIISRAVTSVSKLHALVTGLLVPGGRLLAMKGVYPHAELAELAELGLRPRIEPVSVPGLDEERHVVLLTSAADGDNV